MPLFFACRITPALFTIDVEYSRSENTMREGGLNEDQLVVFHLPARDVRSCHEYVKRQLMASGLCVDDRGLCFHSSAWILLPLLFHQYKSMTQSPQSQNQTHQYSQPLHSYPMIRSV